VIAPADRNPIVGCHDASGGVRRKREERALDHLPAWRDVLAVVAHPDDESFGLGALLASFVAAGSRVSVLCLTHGEASTLHGAQGDLATVRARELAEAAAFLGIARVGLAAFPDGALSQVDLDSLVSELADFVGAARPHGVIVFDRDGVTGHPDHRRATEAAMTYASREHLPVLGWALPRSVAAQLNAEFGSAFSGYAASAIDLRVEVDREPQRAAVACHRSQALPGQALWRRLELTGEHEHLRWQGLPPARKRSAQPRGSRGSGQPGATRTTELLDREPSQEYEHAGAILGLPGCPAGRGVAPWR
jgi:N-acetylglucosamine malate deacetylase 2